MKKKMYISYPRGYYRRFPRIIPVCVVCIVLLHASCRPSSADSVHSNYGDGRKRFRAISASRCDRNCWTTWQRAPCNSLSCTANNRLKRVRICDHRRAWFKLRGRCPTETGLTSKCVTERQDAIEVAKRQNTQVLIPECNKDGSYNEVQCHASSGYCWCVTRDGRHIPGTSVKEMRPMCKSKRKKRKGRGGDIQRRKAIHSAPAAKVPVGVSEVRPDILALLELSCSSKDRQTFNSVLIRVFREEYERVNLSDSVVAGAANGQSDEFGTEKAIVVWKFHELDLSKDGKLKFKEIRNFGKMVKKLIKPRECAKVFLGFCDKNTDRIIDEPEWTLCLGVDIKPSPVETAERDAATLPLDQLREEVLLWPASSILQAPDLPVVSSGPTAGNSADRPDKQDRKEISHNCKEERELALSIHSQEPAAKHYIPACTATGMWETTQCHQSTGYCWCVKEDNGSPIPGTATYKVKPQCSFENEREMKGEGRKMSGCPLEQKRKFFVDLLSDLATERKKVLLESNNQTNPGPDGNLTLRETVASWKLKMLDINNSGILERKEWRPFRRTTLKNKNYNRKCRRSFLRFCDKDSNRKITYDEWKDCLGLNQDNFNSLPLNPKRKGKNPLNLINYLNGD